MNKPLLRVDFDNQEDVKSYFDIVKIEELLQRDLSHDVGKSHIVKFYIILFVYEGQGYHSIDFTDYNYDEGTILLIRKNQIHKFFRSPNVKGYLLIFTDEFIISHLNKMEALRSMQLFNDALVLPKIQFSAKQECDDFMTMIRHLETEYRAKDDFSTGITRSLLHILITKLFRLKDGAGYFVERKKYISQFLEFQALVEEECLHSKKVQYYAKKMGVSTKTLNNITHDIVHNSAKAYIDERTIMQIKRLLIGTDHSIKEIAYMSGFSDPTNFFKYFKKFTGSSPEVFRQAH